MAMGQSHTSAMNRRLVAGWSDFRRSRSGVLARYVCALAWERITSCCGPLIAFTVQSGSAGICSPRRRMVWMSFSSSTGDRPASVVRSGELSVRAMMSEARDFPVGAQGATG